MGPIRQLPVHKQSVITTDRWSRLPPQLYPRPSQRGLYCLKLGKRTYQAVDLDQEVETRDDDPEEKEVLRCAVCQYPITYTSDRIEINEKHHHVFANPHGYVYQIGCFARAPGCVTIGEESSYFSWCPGYTWQIGVCGQCFTLLGWTFRSPDNYFFGLISDKLR